MVPTDPFTILELPNPSHDVSELHKIRRSTDFEALESGKGSSWYAQLLPDSLFHNFREGRSVDQRNLSTSGTVYEALSLWKGRSGNCGSPDAFSADGLSQNEASCKQVRTKSDPLLQFFKERFWLKNSIKRTAKMFDFSIYIYQPLVTKSTRTKHKNGEH